jgi:hypothetical protein
MFRLTWIKPVLQGLRRNLRRRTRPATDVIRRLLNLQVNEKVLRTVPTYFPSLAVARYTLVTSNDG